MYFMWNKNVNIFTYKHLKVGKLEKEFYKFYRKQRNDYTVNNFKYCQISW